jgi:hypothetical protein
VADSAIEELFDRPEIEELDVFAALDHLLQPLEANSGGEVEEGAREGRNGDAVSQRPVVRREGASFVESE